MSIFLFLAPALIGVTLTGLTVINDALSKDDIKKYVNDSSKVYTTNMNNDDILKQALNEYGMKLSEDGTFQTLTDKGNILFLKNENNTYNILFNGTFSDDDVNSFSEDITEYYNSLVQERVYKKLLEKVRENNYQLEHEEITKDSTIVLTINV